MSEGVFKKQISLSQQAPGGLRSLWRHKEEQPNASIRESESVACGGGLDEIDCSPSVAPASGSEEDSEEDLSDGDVFTQDWKTVGRHGRQVGECEVGIGTWTYWSSCWRCLAAVHEVYMSLTWETWLFSVAGTRIEIQILSTCRFFRRWAMNWGLLHTTCIAGERQQNVRAMVPLLVWRVEFDDCYTQARWIRSVALCRATPLRVGRKVLLWSCLR